MAKPNVAGIEIEQLETRCLLNGAAYSAALLGPAHASGVDPGAEARLERSDSAGLNRAGAPPVLVSAHGIPDGLGGPRGPSIEGRVHPPASFIQLSDESIAALFLPAAASYQGHDIGVGATVPEVGFDSYAQAGRADGPPPLVVHVPPPRETPSNSPGSADPLLIPEYTAPFYAKRTPTSATSAEGELPSSKTSSPIIPLSQAGKGDNTNSALARDANAVVVPKGVPNLPILAKDDRIVTGPVDTVRSGAADKAQISLPGYVIESQAAASSTPEARALALQRASLAGAVDLTVAFSGSAADSASTCPLLTSVLPFDFAALEVSIKDFFDQINQAGIKLSESHVNLLFSSGVLAVAATLALEISRRKTAALAQTPALEHASSIPYSDYL